VPSTRHRTDLERRTVKPLSPSSRRAGSTSAWRWWGVGDCGPVVQPNDPDPTGKVTSSGNRLGSIRSPIKPSNMTADELEGTGGWNIRCYLVYFAMILMLFGSTLFGSMLFVRGGATQFRYLARRLTPLSCRLCIIPLPNMAAGAISCHGNWRAVRRPSRWDGVDGRPREMAISVGNGMRRNCDSPQIRRARTFVVPTYPPDGFLPARLGRASVIGSGRRYRYNSGFT
jgi:hypothetical protein